MAIVGAQGDNQSEANYLECSSLPTPGHGSFTITHQQPDPPCALLAASPGVVKQRARRAGAGCDSEGERDDFEQHEEAPAEGAAPCHGASRRGGLTLVAQPQPP
ncbi:hypothetical protein DL764_003060 [Monosporascus ibericus]|uniref:Uncharacterized protein n=1 Tax=Monosporascus ibericus TaxID=155417 RepID=A0A4Q4TJ61_9PEZI|nr:hypothetical protein DL764_003060 [Monosporascus ibericus]